MGQRLLQSPERARADGLHNAPFVQASSRQGLREIRQPGGHRHRLGRQFINANACA